MLPLSQVWSDWRSGCSFVFSRKYQVQKCYFSWGTCVKAGSIKERGIFELFIFFNTSFFFLIFYLFIYLFNIYFWLCWVFVSVRGLPLVAASGGHSSSRCTGLFTIAASLVAEHRLQTRRLSSCGSQAQLLRGMWDLPRPGREPVSPALAGRFSTTAPPGKPYLSYFNLWASYFSSSL